MTQWFVWEIHKWKITKFNTCLFLNFYPEINFNKEYIFHINRLDISHDIYSLSQKKKKRHLLWLMSTHTAIRCSTVNFLQNAHYILRILSQTIAHEISPKHNHPTKWVQSTHKNVPLFPYYSQGTKCTETHLIAIQGMIWYIYSFLNKNLCTREKKRKEKKNFL